MRRIEYFSALALFLAPMPVLVPQGLEALARTPQRTLAQLRADPEEFLGLRVRFTISLAGETDFGNPYFTKFNSARFVRLCARGIEKPVWESDAFADLFSHLFVARDAAFLTALREAKAHQRAEITGVVRDSFRNIPWIEIVDVKLREEWTPEGTIIAVARARKALADGQGDIALSELRMALVDPLPADQKAALAKEIEAIEKSR